MTAKLRNMTSIYLTRGGRMLLLCRRGGRVVDGKWIGSAGGHVEPDELNDPEACVLRELREEMGITSDEISGLCLRYITLRHTKGEIRQNYYFFAELHEDVTRPLVSNEGESRWFELTELPALDMPFTAEHMMAHYLAEGMRDGKLYGGVATGETVRFFELPET